MFDAIRFSYRTDPPGWTGPQAPPIADVQYDRDQLSTDANRALRSLRSDPYVTAGSDQAIRDNEVELAQYRFDRRQGLTWDHVRRNEPPTAAQVSEHVAEMWRSLETARQERTATDLLRESYPVTWLSPKTEDTQTYMERLGTISVPTSLMDSRTRGVFKAFWEMRPLRGHADVPVSDHYFRDSLGALPSGGVLFVPDRAAKQSERARPVLIPRHEEFAERPTSLELMDAVVRAYTQTAREVESLTEQRAIQNPGRALPSVQSALAHIWTLDDAGNAKRFHGSMPLAALSEEELRQLVTMRAHLGRIDPGYQALGARPNDLLLARTHDRAGSRPLGRLAYENLEELDLPSRVSLVMRDLTRQVTEVERAEDQLIEQARVQSRGLER